MPADHLVGAPRQARDERRAPGRRPRLAEDVAVEARRRVSTPSTSPCGASAATASALRRAFSSATSDGSPVVSSSTSETRTVKAMPICSRIARRWGERREDQAAAERSSSPGRRARLAQAGLGRVRAVDHVLCRPRSRSRRGSSRWSASSGFVAPITWRAALIASSPSRTSATIGPEVMKLDELAEERALRVLGVVLLGEVLGDRHVLGGDDREALAFEAGDDLPGQAARERVRLDQDQGLFNSHRPSVCQRRRRREVSPAEASAGSGCATSAATVAWSVV